LVACVQPTGKAAASKSSSKRIVWPDSLAVDKVMAIAKVKIVFIVFKLWIVLVKGKQ
jgi:hypothetical protein